jgi:hypothetical protein
MKLLSRVAATGTAVLTITALAIPLASSASAAPARYNDNGKIRVCVQGLRGGDADIRVAGYRREVDSGDCTTFRGLRSGRTYRVTASPDRGCRIDNSTKWVTARRDGRTVTFYGRCFNNRWDNDRGNWGNDRGGRGDNNWGNDRGGNRGPRG